MNARAPNSSTVDESALHWLTFFLAVCERLQVNFWNVEPEPVTLIREVVDGMRSLDDLDAQCDLWSEVLVHSGKYLDIGSADVMPLRVAILMASVRSKHGPKIEQTITDIGYMGEWFDVGLSRMGYEPGDYHDLWTAFKANWSFTSG